MSKAIIYLRVSTEEQAEKGFSLQAQRDECTLKAKELGCSVILEYCDEGVSGSILERPMLMNALERLSKQEIEYFICYDSSRLSRNVSHQLILIDSIKKNGGKLIFIRNNYEDSAEGRFQITIMAAVDEYERARLKVRTELGKRAKANQRLLTHNPGLYGYDFDKDTDTLKVNKDQAAILRTMFDWLINESMGPSEIAKKLNALNIPSMHCKKWSRVVVNRILNNYSYTGTLYIRRYDTRDYKLNKYKKKDEKQKIIERPKEQWIPIEIPAIIDKATWQNAKNILEKSKRIYKNPSDEAYLLTGLLKCDICNGTMFGRKTSKKGIIMNKYYCCANKYNYSKTANDRCSSKLIKAESLESLIWNLFKNMILNIEGIAGIIKDENQENDRHSKNTADIMSVYHETKNEKEKVMRMFQKGLFDETELDVRLLQIDNMVELMEKQINDSKRSSKALDIFNGDTEELKLKLDNYMERLNTNQRNKLLHRLISEVSISSNMVHVKVFLPNNIVKSLG